jgi:autotransporter-associated beta strand protein
VTFSGGGVVILLADNTNTGTLTINSGNVQVGYDGTSGAIASKHRHHRRQRPNQLRTQ